MSKKIMSVFLATIAASIFVSTAAFAALNETGACELARQWVPGGA